RGPWGRRGSSPRDRPARRARRTRRSSPRSGAPRPLLRPKPPPAGVALTSLCVTPLDELRAAVEAAAADLRNGAAPASAKATLEQPKQAGFGDYSTNAAMLLAPALGEP